MRAQFETMCNEAGFNDDGGTFSCGPQGIIVLYMNMDETAVYVSYTTGTKCFFAVEEAIEFAKSNI